MSDQQSKFIRQLKITLIRILGPFILFIILSLVNDHYKIKSNAEHIRLVEETHVTNDMMIRYVDEFRRAYEVIAKDIDTSESKNIAEFDRISKRIDAIIIEMYPRNTRGVKDTVK
jgi:hypothetical protein